MDGLYLTSPAREDGRRLTIAPLSSRKLSRCAELPEDVSGYFLFEEDGADASGEVTILAHIASGEAALRLASMFKME